MSATTLAVQRWWPILTVAAGIIATASVDTFRITANAEEIEILDDAINENRVRLNSLERGDDNLRATIELENTKLRAQIEQLRRMLEDADDEQAKQLNAILRLLEQQQ